MISEVEKKISRKFGRKHCVVVGSGTAAIYLILKSLSLKKNDSVLMPGTCCFSPAYAVKYAGLKIDFCDISLLDGCITPETLRIALDRNRDIKVLIGVHLYGNILKIDSVKKICKEYEVVFIEDACQAYGSLYKNKPCGAFGDYSVLSFGHTKVLNAGGGGAVLTDNDVIVRRIRKRADSLNSYNTRLIQQLSRKHGERYYEIQNKVRSDLSKKYLFAGLWKNYRDLFLCGISKKIVKNIELLMENENTIIRHRVKLKAIYEQELNKCLNIRVLKSPQKAIPWRFNFLLKKRCNKSFCDDLRTKGFDVSSWYPNLAGMFESDFKRKLPSADELERRIVNFWVDQTKNGKDVKKLCRFVKEYMNSN
jgi:dTDP-4-amino-4,6-dideoxygalactose transaminase